jgi:hypothetical protein
MTALARLRRGLNVLASLAAAGRECGMFSGGASHSTPDGGSCSTVDVGRRCHCLGSASMAPWLPIPDPP